MLALTACSLCAASWLLQVNFVFDLHKTPEKLRQLTQHTAVLGSWGCDGKPMHFTLPPVTAESNATRAPIGQPPPSDLLQQHTTKPKQNTDRDIWGTFVWDHSGILNVQHHMLLKPEFP